MDLTESIAPKSDQLNADDLMSGPRTVTIKDVRAGNADQPVDVVTVEFGDGRPFKPSKSMRRVMVACWGAQSSEYVGHRMTLFRDPTVKWGGIEIGGIRISHMSHIDATLTIALTTTRGKRSPYIVKPLVEQQPPEPATQSDADLAREDLLRFLKSHYLNPADAVTRWAAHSDVPLRDTTDADGIRAMQNEWEQEAES
jgi:hypothetical protein